MAHTSSDQDGDNTQESKIMLTIPIVNMADPAAPAAISNVLGGTVTVM